MSYDTTAQQRPSVVALKQRGENMTFTEFEERVRTTWREKEAGRNGKDAQHYPYNEDLIGFKLNAARLRGLDFSDDLMLTAALNARMPELERDRFRAWGQELKRLAKEMIDLENQIGGRE
jgi:hypothetical protein